MASNSDNISKWIYHAYTTFSSLLGQVFILSIPPKLAGDWFPENEANLATAIGVSANNLGVAVGCIWSPMAIRPDTMQEDIPWLLLLQVMHSVL